MLTILLVLNLLALIFMIVILYSIEKQFKRIFLYGAFIPLTIIAIISIFAFAGSDFGWQEVIFFFIRGGFILAVISGSFTCYFVSKYQKAKNNLTIKGK